MLFLAIFVVRLHSRHAVVQIRCVRDLLKIQPLRNLLKDFLKGIRNVVAGGIS